MKDNKSKISTDFFELEESAIERKLLFEKINDLSEQFVDTIKEQKAFHYDSHELMEGDLFFEINKKKNSLEDILGFFQERVLNTGLNAASGGHLGYIPGVEYTALHWATTLLLLPIGMQGCFMHPQVL